MTLVGCVKSAIIEILPDICLETTASYYPCKPPGTEAQSDPPTDTSTMKFALPNPLWVATGHPDNLQSWVENDPKLASTDAWG